MATKTNPSPPPPHIPPSQAEARKEAEAEFRLDQAHLSVQRNVYWAMGAGVLPLPVFDIVAITGVQLKMLRELSKLYDVPFKESVAKKAITSLLVGVGGVGIGGVVGASMFKFIPIVGQSLGVISVPVVSGMLTHAIGRTFVMHFESGGSLLDFDAKSMRKYFKKEYSSAKDVVDNMKQDANQAQPKPA